MAHVGKIYPYAQELRYLHNTAIYPAWAAKEYLVTSNDFVGSIALPAAADYIVATLWNWQPGDAFAEWRADLPTSGPEHCQIGWRYELTGNFNQGNRLWSLVWVDDVRQNEWTEEDYADKITMDYIHHLGLYGRVPGWVLSTNGGYLAETRKWSDM